MKKTLLATAALCVALAASAAAAAEAARISLQQALEAYIRQSGKQVIYRIDDIRGIVVSQDQVNRAASEGLGSLLAGTGFTTRSDASGAIALVRIPERQNIAATSAQYVATQGASAVAASPAVSARAAASTPITSEIGEVIVTGSRVIKNGNASPTPTTIITTQQLLEMQPGPISEAIAILPVFDGSRTATSNPGSGTSNGGADHLQLRFMGFNRTLVLFDGKRVGPSTFDQLVDTDVIPQMLLQRVDVVTGGVGAVYGSDAVSGVVNFVSDRNFNGLKLNAQAGISTYGDDPTQSIGIAAGTRLFDGKGHFEFSYQYQHDAGLSRRSLRDNGLHVYGLFGAGTAASPIHLTDNTRISTATFGGLITGATGTGTALNNQTFTTAGQLSPFINGTNTGTTGVQENGGSGAYNDASAKAALQTHQLYGRFDYEFSDSLSAYVQGTYSQNTTETFESYERLTNVSFNGLDPFLPTQNQFTGTFKFNQLNTQFPRVTTDAAEKQYFVIAGLDGKVKDWKWEVGLNLSEADTTTANPAQVDNAKLYAALDATKDSTGNIVCRVTVTNPGLYPGCVPLNLFGVNAASQAAINYVLTPTQFTNINTMQDFTASITGTPFQLPAGPVGVALSSEWRRQTLQVNSSAQPTDVINCTGLTLNCTAGATARWADFVLASLPQVNQQVGEVAVEADVPLIAGAPFFKDLAFNGAARYTNYNTSGSAWTWKAGLIWQVDDQWKLRATSSRDIRAPNLYDLYQPLGLTVGPVLDSLTNVQVNVPLYTGGNPTLKPEIGNTTTAGFVYQPGWLPRFSFSVDAYYINIDNALQSINGSTLGTQLNCYASGGASPTCGLIVRPLGLNNTTTANNATAFYSREINVGYTRTYGADFEANYTAMVADHPLNLRALVTWQPHQILYYDHVIEGAGYAFAASGSDSTGALPQVRATLFADYAVGPLKVSAKERWRSSLSMASTPNVIYSGNLTVPSVAYTDMNFAYTVKREGLGSSELFVNVENLLNQQPPPSARGTATRIGNFGGFASGDDPIGRYFTLGVRFRH